VTDERAGDGLIDRERLRAMSAAPLTRETWKRHLRAHRKFLDTRGSGGHWELLAAAGLPLAIWRGAQGEGEQLNLSFANLAGLDLRLATLVAVGLAGVVAEGQCFRGATLDGSLLADAFLDGADFTMAKLERVDFSRASLRGACFKKAHLLEADFEGCDLTAADFTGAKVNGAKFRGAVMADVIGFPQPIFSGLDPAAELAEIVRFFPRHERGQQLSELARRHDRPTLLRCLVAALREGGLPFDRDSGLWSPLTAADAVSHYDVEDYLRLVAAIAGGAPDGHIIRKGGWSNLWTDADIPGCVSGLHWMLKHKHASGDAAFFTGLERRRHDLPSPYDVGVAVSLVQLGYLSWRELPEGLVDLAATRWTTASPFSRTPAPGLWPAEIWGPALVRRALDPAASPPNSTVLMGLAEHATLEQLVELALRSPADTQLFEVVSKLESLPEKAEARACAWEAAARRLRFGEAPLDGAPPSPLVIVCMLRACASAGREPKEELDVPLGDFLAHYRPCFSGGGFQAFHDRLREAFTVLPLPRRERIALLAGAQLAWDFAPIASTPRVAQCVVDRLFELGEAKRVAPEWLGPTELEHRLAGGNANMYGQGALRSFGPEGLAVFGRALRRKGFHQRHILVRLLAESHHPDAAPGLVAAVGDKQAAVRSLALEGLVALPDAWVQDALRAALWAPQKAERLPAAAALAALPATAARRALAGERLRVERVAAVRAQLERVGAA